MHLRLKQKVQIIGIDNVEVRIFFFTRMSCLTVFTLVEALIFLAGILSPGWVRIVQESLTYGTNSTNYGLFYYMKCTRDGCLANTFYEDSFNHSYQGLLFV